MTNCIDQKEVRALIESNNEVNAIAFAYISKPDLKVCSTDVEAQKIDLIYS